VSDAQSDIPLPSLPPRDQRGHKGTFGTVGVVGGCCAGQTRMIGAPALAALGALRAGVGRARLAMPAPILPHGMLIAVSATGLAIPVGPTGEIEPHDAAAAIDAAAERCDCLVVGPGLGLSSGSSAAALRAVQQHDLSVVLDADAITSLASIPELLRDFRAAAILTPHPGEFRSLAKPLGIEEDPVDPKTRPRAAEHMAQRLGCIVVLKGAGTVVSDGHRTWVNHTGNAVLAAAGTGDVLAGILAGLIAQFVAKPEDARPWPMPAKPRPSGKPLDLFDAARLGVAAHALAADRWRSEHAASAGMLAVDLLAGLPAVIESMRAT
jgi:ADP-dependent NAD(P)H-hydrate dehydratase